MNREDAVRQLVNVLKEKRYHRVQTRRMIDRHPWLQDLRPKGKRPKARDRRLDEAVRDLVHSS